MARDKLDTSEQNFCYHKRMVWLVVILILIILILFLSQWAREKAREKVDQTIGICNFALEQSVSKQKNKQKILDLFEKEKELSNEQIRDSIQVSDRSVIRYMDELEKEGKVKQTGKTGRSVVYVLRGS